MASGKGKGTGLPASRGEGVGIVHIDPGGGPQLREGGPQWPPERGWGTQCLGVSESWGGGRGNARGSCLRCGWAVRNLVTQRHHTHVTSCLLCPPGPPQDLSVLGRDLAHTVIVDNSPQAFGFQVRAKASSSSSSSIEFAGLRLRNRVPSIEFCTGATAVCRWRAAPAWPVSLRHRHCTAPHGRSAP